MAASATHAPPSGPPATTPQRIAVKLVNCDGRSVEVTGFDLGASMEVFTACVLQARKEDWGTRLKPSHLVLFYAGPKAPTHADEAAILQRDPLGALETLSDVVGACKTAYFLVKEAGGGALLRGGGAGVAAGTTGAGGAGVGGTGVDLSAAITQLAAKVEGLAMRDHRLTAIAAKVEGLATRDQVSELQQQVILSRYAATHALSATSEELVKKGAIFYVVDEESRPLFCGFFVGKRAALTINHDILFQQRLPFYLSAVASSGRRLQFKCVATDAELNYSVLLLVGATDSEAFFDLPAHSSVTPGLSLGLVSMGVGLSLHHATAPAFTVHSVTVSSLDPSNALFYYDGAATWQGHSGAALLFEEGCVVGMHQEVLDDKPELSPTSGTSGGMARVAKRNREQLLHERVDQLSVASSSHAKVCRALMLSHVCDAVELLEVELSRDGR